MTTFCAQRRRLWWAILCGLVGISVAQTTTDLQDDPSFIGYYIAVSSTQVLTVGEGKSWVTSGTFAGDCSGTTACTFATACGDNTITYGNGDTDSCGDASCVEFTIFQTSPFGLPSALNIGCRIGWTANTVYRELDAGTTTEATTTTTAKTPSTSM
ncbi:hypothetical protein BX600DRAFT_159232 [Xylariales sp. PMI_506]|nr:hypothetical protein BX600DRAFT_159232 [Xylariales sp. PMI_506]